MNREEEEFLENLHKIGTAMRVENAADLLYSLKFITKEKRDYIVMISSPKTKEKPND